MTTILTNEETNQPANCTGMVKCANDNIPNLVVVVVDDHYPPPCTLPAAHRISEPAAPGIYFSPKTKTMDRYNSFGSISIFILKQPLTKIFNFADYTSHFLPFN